MLFYHIWTLPILTNIYVAKTKQRMADTHLSIETTYIAYPICYTMMLPNMPFRKADAHPLRLNTRCKDLTLVPSTSHIVIYVSNDINGYLSIYISWYHVSLLYIKYNKYIYYTYNIYIYYTVNIYIYQLISCVKISKILWPYWSSHLHPASSWSSHLQVLLGFRNSFPLLAVARWPTKVHLVIFRHRKPWPISWSDSPMKNGAFP